MNSTNHEHNAPQRIMSWPLPLSAVPERCGSCGWNGRTWPLGIHGNRVGLVCPECHVLVAVLVACSAEDG